MCDLVLLCSRTTEEQLLSGDTDAELQDTGGALFIRLMWRNVLCELSYAKLIRPVKTYV